VASSIVTNYHLPEHEMSVTVPCSVSYDSDLDHVERVTVEVGEEVMQEVNGAIPEHGPTVRYNAFGGSGISFNVGLRAADISAQALITHEFIKRLHARYQKEGISNTSPAETIVHTSSEEPAAARPVALAGAVVVPRARRAARHLVVVPLVSRPLVAAVRHDAAGNVGPA
jgi:small-conductance mechanosensitive channel